MQRLVFANYDDEGVHVYQAFKPKTVEIAAELGTFGKGFGFDRTSWIKPSYAWTLRRSKYGTKHRMQGLAKIKISHPAFIEILEQSIEAHWNAELYPKESDWKHALDSSEVLHQWDPERDLIGKRLDRQAIQIALRGSVLRKYVTDFIIGVENVSELSHQIGKIVKARSGSFPEVPEVPEEKEYPISNDLFQKLGCLR